MTRPARLRVPLLVPVVLTALVLLTGCLPISTRHVGDQA